MFLCQVENGKLCDHEFNSTMEHLRLLLPLVLSATRARSEGSGAGEWQEDSGVGLYRDPNEGAGPMTSVQSVDLEKKVSFSRFDVACNHSVHLVKWESNHLLLLLFFFFHQQVNALENIVCVLNREVERSSVTMEAFAHQHRLDQEKIENLSNKVRQLERTLTMRDLQLSETEQLMRELQFCTYDGVFVWKISDFSRRRQDAVAGRAPAMFSPGRMEKHHVWYAFR